MDAPKVVLRPNASLTSPASTAPPMKMKFTVTVPTKQLHVPVESAELYGRLYNGSPVVEAHSATLHPHEIVVSGTASTTRRLQSQQRSSSPLAVRAAQELRELWEGDEVVTFSAGSTAQFESTMQSLRTSIELPQHGTLNDSAGNALGAAMDTVQPGAVTQSAPSVTPYKGLQVVGTAHLNNPQRATSPTVSPSPGFRVDPLDALFPPRREPSPKRRTRSHSAPAAGRRYDRHSASYSGSFSAGVPLLRSFTPRAKVKAVRASVPSATVTVRRSPSPPPPSARRKSGVWVPSSPLHAISFYRTMGWKGRKGRGRSPSPDHAHEHQELQRSRSLSPRMPSLPRRTAAADGGHHKAVVVVNGERRGIKTTPPVKQYPSRPPRSASPKGHSASTYYAETKEMERSSPGYSNESLPKSLNPDHSSYDAFYEPPATAPPLPFQDLSQQPTMAASPLLTLQHPMDLPWPAPLTIAPSYEAMFPPPSPVSFHTTINGFPPASPPMVTYVPVLMPSPQPYSWSTTATVPFGSSGGTFGASLAGRSNAEWWARIQQQKRQHEMAGYQAALGQNQM
jgi:hypothetical protein